MIKATLLLLAFMASFIYLTLDYLDRPYLFTSTETKQCAYIELTTGERLGCEYYDPNQRYITMWSKQQLL